MPISNLIIALLLTIVVECLAALISGYRKKYQIYIIVLINIITNPALNFILIVLRMTGMYSHFFLLVLESAVVVSEWRIMVYAFKNSPKKLLILSFVFNSASYAVGVLALGF